MHTIKMNTSLIVTISISSVTKYCGHATFPGYSENMLASDCQRSTLPLYLSLLTG